MYTVKRFIQSSRVVTTVTKPKLHLAAERKYRNNLWLTQFWLCWVFRAVPILARLQFKLWCCMDWLQVTPVIQHAFWKVWLTFPLLETKIHCKNLLVQHILWKHALYSLWLHGVGQNWHTDSTAWKYVSAPVKQCHVELVMMNICVAMALNLGGFL